MSDFDMDGHRYEKELKKAKTLQREINSTERERVIGNVITLPLRVFGRIIKKTLKLLIILVVILIILGFIAAGVMFYKTGNLSFLESWR